MKKFTFKQHPHPSGLEGVVQAGKTWVDIKLNKKVVGTLFKEGSLYPVDIRFKIHKKDIMEDGNPNCEWRWTTLKHKPTTIEEAKLYLLEFNDVIQQKFNLYIDEE